MIHLFATYDHQRIDGTARSVWYAVVYLERKSTGGMWYCNAVDALANIDRVYAHYQFRRDDYQKRSGNNYIAICEALPKHYDSITRNLELAYCATDLRILNVVSICNHLRREARVAQRAITEQRAMERITRDYRASNQPTAAVGPDADSGANEHQPGHKQAREA